jgi:hypothetical protein
MIRRSSLQRPRQQRHELVNAKVFALNSHMRGRISPQTNKQEILNQERHGCFHHRRVHRLLFRLLRILGMRWGSEGEQKGKD